MDLKDLGKEPVGAEKPAGADVRYDPDFEQLQGEIDKLAVASSESAGVDWKRVVELGTAILGGKSKHMLVAAYLGAGLLHTSGLGGLATSATILKDLVENFWETLFPPVKRMQGRMNAVQWWLERVQSFLEKTEFKPQEAEFVEELRKTIDALDQALSEKSEDAPNLRSLRDPLGRIPVAPRAAPEPPPAPSGQSAGAAPAERASRPASAPAGPSLGGPVEIVTAKDAEQLLESAFRMVSRVSEYLMRNDLANPLCYRLTRMAAWSTLEALPPVEDGNTMLPPPDEAIRNSIENLMANRSFEDAVNAAEASIPVFLFWLDLNYFTVRAMEMLGPRFDAARETICMEATSYIQRLPGIENLRFSDGTPFADKDTRVWLKSMQPGKGGAPTGAAGAGGVEALVAEAFDKARALMTEKKTTEAIQLFQDRLRSGESGRERLTWRIGLARFLVDMGRADLAKPHFRWILEEIERFRLEEWDPLVAVDGLRVVYEGMKAEATEDSEATLRDIFERIARIRPVDVPGLLVLN